jgi:hypothetical protein
MPDRPVPLLGSISLKSVQRIEHGLASGFSSTPIAGLAGELQQRTNRLSHRVRIEGTLFGDSAADDLKSLQQAAANGEELTFSADISKALDLQKVVITNFYAAQGSGHANFFRYDLDLTESPPLPPPAQVSGFGGLDDFGLGDLGFDTDILGDIADAAASVAGAVNDALSVVDTLSALTNLDGLDLGNFLKPMSDSADRVSSIGGNMQKAFGGLSKAFS